MFIWLTSVQFIYVTAEHKLFFLVEWNKLIKSLKILQTFNTDKGVGPLNFFNLITQNINSFNNPKKYIFQCKMDYKTVYVAYNTVYL